MNSKSSDTSEPDLGILTSGETFIYSQVSPIGVVPNLFLKVGYKSVSVRRAEYLGMP